MLPKKRKRRSLFDEFNHMLWNPFEEFEFENMIMNLQQQEYEGLTEEEFEVVKGNVKTIIKYKFNKEGFPVIYSHVSEYIPTEQESNLNKLETEKKEALEDEDYLKAAEIQKKIKEIEAKTNSL